MVCLTWSLCALDRQGEVPLTDGAAHLSRGAHVHVEVDMV